MTLLRRAGRITAAAAVIVVAGLAVYAAGRSLRTGITPAGRDAVGHARSSTDADPRGAFSQEQAEALIGEIAAHRARLARLVLSIQQAKTALLQINAQLAHRPGTAAMVTAPDVVPLRMQAAANADRPRVPLVQARAALIVRIRALDDERADTLTALAGLVRDLDRAKRRLAEHQW
jgi:hypothetical protein